MYKVFINEGVILLSDMELMGASSYEGREQLEEAIEQLESNGGLKIFYHPNLEDLWSDFTSFFTPITAAGGLVVNKSREVLMIKRHGIWDLPKGKVDQGENVEDAAIREVQEEAGLSYAKLDEFFESSYHTYQLNGSRILKTTHWYLMTYRATESFKPQAEEGITEARWFNRVDLKKELPDCYGNIQLLLKRWMRKY